MRFHYHDIPPKQKKQDTFVLLFYYSIFLFSLSRSEMTYSNLKICNHDLIEYGDHLWRAGAVQISVHSDITALVYKDSRYSLADVAGEFVVESAAEVAKVFGGDLFSCFFVSSH